MFHLPEHNFPSAFHTNAKIESRSVKLSVLKRGNSLHSKTKTALFIALLAAIAVFYAATLRPGNDWGDDFALYIRHAHNIASGVPYQDTGYIYDAHYPYLSPRYYPPVFPLLLAPVTAVFGLDLTPMRVEGILFFILFLIVFERSFRRRLAYPYRMLAVGILGFSPVFWSFKENVLSDIPFLFFTYLALYGIQHAYEVENPGKKKLLQAAEVGLLVYLSYGTRTVGGVLIPALFVLEVLRRKRLGWFPPAATFSFAVCAALQSALIPGSSGYADQLVFSLTALLNNLLHTLFYLFAFLPRFGEHGTGLVLSIFSFILFLSVMLLGFLRRVKSGLGIYEVFGPLYFAVIVAWNAADQGPRLLFPIFPLMLVYLLEVVQALAPALAKNRKWTAVLPTALTAIFFLASGLVFYRGAEYDEMPAGPLTQDSTALFQYVRANTPQNATLVFFKPRALALYTDRRASACGARPKAAALASCFDQIGAEYVISAAAFDIYHYENLLAAQPDRFQLVYQNNSFRMYRYLPPGSG